MAKCRKSAEKVPESDNGLLKSVGNYIKVELTKQQQIIYKRIVEKVKLPRLKWKIY